METWTAILRVAALVHAAVLLRAILVEDREPYARAAWIVFLVAAPVVSTVLYALFGEPWVSKRFRRNARDAYEDVLRFAPPASARAVGGGASQNAFRTCEHVACWPATGGNRAWVAPDSDAAIARMVEDIDGARDYVHLSFYIWLADNNGRSVADAVVRAAGRGVTCRIAADAIGSRALIHSGHWTAMREAGARMCASLKAPLGLGFLAGHRIDLRNHRKIAVIDGGLTYCGSQNCADPAFLPKRKFAPWVDILIRYEGPVARHADLLFASAWTAETGEELSRALDKPPPAPLPDGFDAISVGTGPLSPHSTMTRIFIAVLSQARERLTVTTPYFAPDPPLLEAIVAAGRRGVEVRIVFPQRNDSRIVGAISRAYYPILARAGVRIFEFRGGLLHAKTVVVDGRLALVGSANMDRRSLDLNFENNVLLECPKVCAEVGALQEKWLSDAIEIDHGGVAERALPRRLVDNLLTIVAALF